MKLDARNTKHEKKSVRISQQGISAIILLIGVGLLAAAGAGAVSYLVVNRPETQTQVQPTATPAPTEKSEIGEEPLQVDKFNPILPTESKVSNYQRTIIGKTTENEVIKLPGLKQKVTLPDGSSEYTFSSPLGRDNAVVVKDGKVVYERAITVDPSSLVHPKLSDFRRQYGQPEKVLQGSKYYGEYINAYIWAQKGVVAIANPYTDEIAELQLFLPLTADEYQSKWGQDYQPSDDQIIENF